MSNLFISKKRKEENVESLTALDIAKTNQKGIFHSFRGEIDLENLPVLEK